MVASVEISLPSLHLAILTLLHGLYAINYISSYRGVVYTRFVCYFVCKGGKKCKNPVCVWALVRRGARSVARREGRTGSRARTSKRWGWGGHRLAVCEGDLLRRGEVGVLSRIVPGREGGGGGG